MNTLKHGFVWLAVLMLGSLTTAAQTNASNGRFTRGTDLDPSLHSFVVPLSWQKGVAYDASGGNATTWYPNNEWTQQLYHFNATNSAAQYDTVGRIPFKNPIAAFGSRVGGTPLFVGASYDFGMYAGNPFYDFDDGSFLGFGYEVYLNVYHRSNSALVASVELPVPDNYETNDWIAFGTNGYTVSMEAYGLKTVLSSSPYARWGSQLLGTFILTHTASDAATNYFFMVDAIGQAGFPADPPMVLNDSGQYWSPLYTLEFEPRPPSRLRFFDQPHFEGEPLPPAYQTRTVEELLSVKATMPDLSAFAPSNYIALTNQSPELRTHSALDRFVADRGSNALALANYVVNEIELVDVMDYDTNQNQQTAVYLGGINRSALAVYQEGRGSPVEQCALLVYLLRRAGVPAAFVYPTNNGLEMLDVQLSQLFGYRVRGAQLDYGFSIMPHQIPVNYPWVAAYVGTSWVHVFPWLKDTEIIEGLDLYELMPTNYDNGYKWLVRYLERDPAIMDLGGGSDQPAVLFPKFMESQLRERAPGVSLDDIGVRLLPRKHLYARWADFPKPFALDGPVQVLESHKDNLNLFNTLEVHVYSVNATNKYLTTGELRVADLHNRALTLKPEQVGQNNVHDLTLSLEAYDPAVGGSGTFGPGADPYAQLSATVQLHSTNDLINFRTVHRRLKMLPGGYEAAAREANVWHYAYVEEGVQNRGLLYTNESTFRKGDLVAFCLDVGRVSPQMLRVHAEDLWRLERQIASAPSQALTDAYLLKSTYLMGMSYWEFFDRFQEQNQRLHKSRELANYSYGFGLLRPKRESDALPNNGQIIWVTPGMDVPVHGHMVVFNGTVRTDSGWDHADARQDYLLINAAHASAAEHGTVASFYRTNAVSTVRLLHNVSAANILRLNRYNYQSAAATVYNGQTLPQHDPQMWDAVVSHFNNNAPDDFYKQAFLTPGAQTVGTYTGMGAFLLAPGGYGALISGLLNGAAGYQLPDTALLSANSGEFATRANPPGSPTLYSFGLGSEVNQASMVAGSVAEPDLESVHAGITGGTVPLDPSIFFTTTVVNSLYGVIDGTAADGFRLMHDPGVIGSFLSVALDGAAYAADPVNVVSGEFYVDATDLMLPGPMPLSVRRNYSSLNLAENQFGFGWKLNYMPFLSVGADADILFAAEPDGTMIAYARTATNANVWLPDTGHNPHLANKTSAGIGSTANPFNGRIELATVNGTNTYTMTTANGSTRTFEERSYPLGATFTRQRPYLVTWQDHRGNSYAFEYGTDTTQTDYGQVRRVQSSNGGFLGFIYDVYGHVIEVYTGDGRRLFYTYDSYGDLIQTTLPDMSTLEYEYQHSTFVTNSVTNAYSTHLLVRELKPDGRILENQYDNQRRVTNQLSTVGVDLTPIRNATFIYSNNFALTNPYTDTISGYTLVVDVFNRTSRYDYTDSLITKVTDPLNQYEEQLWYADDATAPGHPRSLWKRRDKRGLWTEFKYDGLGNVTNTVTWGDLTGEGTTSYATNSVTYNANNLPLENTDAAGNKVVTVYDSTFPFLPESVSRYAGATPVSTSQFTYYSVTNTFSSGGVTYTNLAVGLLQREIRAFNSANAATNVWSHDGRGFITERVRYTGTSDPAVTNFFFYNDRGEVVERTDGAGRSTVFDHDGLGRPIVREVYEAGQDVPLAWEYSYYNENGELTWSDGPRFDPEDYVWRDFDGAGRQTTEIRWRSQAKSDGSGVEAVPGGNLYAITLREFDAFGNLTRVIDPRGAVTTNTWDSIGRLVERRSLDLDGALLSTEGFSYEPGGKVAFHTNALGGVTATLYTATGQPRHRLLPDGSTNGWRYYTDGRLRREYGNNGNYWESTYDDSLRSATKVFYTAGGAPLATNLTVLDRRGNLIRTVDVLGNSFTNVFDGLDRLRETLGPQVSFVPPTNAPPALGGNPPPLQLHTTTYFDAAGVVTTTVNGLGEKTITYTDALDRVTRTEVRNAANALVRETGLTYAQNHHSVTTTNGSGSTAILTTRFTDNDGRNVLSVGYPSANVTHFTLRDFDLAGNRAFEGRYARTNSTKTPFTSAIFSYDGLNRLTEKIDRDAASTTFAYNAAGDLTNRVVPGELSWNAAYSNAGQMLTNWNASSGGAVVRANGFTYYGAGHVWAGLLATHTDARGVVRTDSYDAWLRRINSAYSGSLAEQNLTTSWQYDLRGLVTNVVEQFASTNTGPDTIIGRDYNPYGLLTQETVRFGTNDSYSGSAYNSAGRRASLGVGSFGANFTWRADGRLTGVDTLYGDTGYGWDTAGLLTNRAAEWRNTMITSRDGMGRPLTLETKVNGVTQLAETLAYTGDGLITSHTLERGDFTDSRSYAYAGQSRRLTEERLNIDGSTGWTNAFTYDSGVEHGPGVLTKIAQPGSGGAAWDAHIDAHLRIDRETNNVVRRLAYGRVNMQPNFGYATLGVALNGRPVPFLTMGTSDTNWPSRWQAQIEITPGTHTLTATAVHPSKLYTNTTSVTFTNQALDQTVLTYYSEGQLTDRVWKNSQGATNRVETYQWDGRGRLYRFTERDVNGDGHNWTAVYDAFNRKLQTETVPVTNSVAYASQLKTVTHLYDPLVEFMDLGVRVDGRWHWKVYGPDLNGQYGGLNGTGGWDATVTGPSTFYPTIQDARGNILGAADPETGSVLWNKARVTAYGSIPEHRPRSLGEGVSLWESGSYRGRFPELSGLINLGMRYYQPMGGYFISADQQYDPANPSDFSFAGGDGENYFDADGRWGRQASDFITNFELPLPGIGGRDAQETFNQTVSSVVSAPGELVTTFDEYARGISIPAPGVGGPSAQEEFSQYVNGSTLSLGAGIAIDVLNGPSGEGLLPLFSRSAAKTEANVTRLGITRNNPADWRATRDLWDQTGYGGILSDANRSAIARGRTPVVDQSWISHFPEDAGLLGERIPMHHVGGGPITVPLPATRHLDAHMPGGFRYNPGGPGSALPVYPAPNP